MSIFNRKASLGPGPVFAVVDVETTGLNPSSASVVEVGVSLLDRYFIEIGRWETLINPGKAVRGTSVHGIKSAMVKEAPTFSEIYTELSNVLEGKITIAHNARFDSSFLDAAAANAYQNTWKLPRPFSPGWVDSLDLARQVVPVGPYKLATLAKHFGITNPGAHSAGADAATAGYVLAAMFREDPDSAAKQIVKRAPVYHETRRITSLRLPSSPALPRRFAEA